MTPTVTISLEEYNRLLKQDNDNIHTKLQYLYKEREQLTEKNVCLENRIEELNGKIDYLEEKSIYAGRDFRQFANNILDMERKLKSISNLLSNMTIFNSYEIKKQIEQIVGCNNKNKK